MTGATFGSDCAIMSFDNFAYNRQANAGALIGTFAVQALKDSKDAIQVLFIEADTIIPNRQYTELFWGGGLGGWIILNFSRDVHERRKIGLMELQGIV